MKPLGDMQARLARLRGALHAEEPGARGIERVARNPACTRLRALTMVSITPATAVKNVYGETVFEGQSPFALAAGNRFEEDLFASGAAKLLELYVSAGRLEAQECKVVVVPDHDRSLQSGPSRKQSIQRNMALRRNLTRQLLTLKLNGDPRAPNIIIKPRLSVSLLGVEHDIEPDALVSADSEGFYRPVEVKSYPDRAGKTDLADIRSACRQAAVGVVALRSAVGSLGLLNHDEIVTAMADLVLKIPGYSAGSLRPMTLSGEVDSLERALNEAPRNLEELEALLADITRNATLSDSKILDSIPNNYLPECREYCALALHCKQEAVSSGNPVLLGKRASEELAAAGSLGRTLDLLRSREQPARTEAEGMLQAELQDVFQDYQEVLNGR